jgi:hypothetical protein
MAFKKLMAPVSSSVEATFRPPAVRGSGVHRVSGVWESAPSRPWKPEGFRYVWTFLYATNS